MSVHHKMSRRRFLANTTGLTFAFALPACNRENLKSNAVGRERPLTAWVKIDVDNTITIMSPASELGQGSMTAIPMIFAEELDADWDRVRIEFSPAEDEIFKNPTWWAWDIMLTLGSSSVSGYYDSLRLFGSQARKVLLMAAADDWRVPIEELTTGPSVVKHSATARCLTYGEIVAFFEPPDRLPEVTESGLKNPDDFRIIGSDLPRYDIPFKVRGVPIYSIDTYVPDMVFAAIVRSPRRGGRPINISNRRALEKGRDILELVTLPDAVAVVARTYEAAFKAEKMLSVDWSPVPKLSAYSDVESLEEHAALARDLEMQGATLQEKGDANGAIRDAAKIYEAEYRSDYVYHAQLEPLNSVAHVKPDGRSVEIWAGTQAPTHCTRSVAEVLRIPVENVRLHRSYVGGAFGRRGAQDHDYVTDAVLLSREELRFPAPVSTRITTSKIYAGRFWIRILASALHRYGASAVRLTSLRQNHSSMKSP